MKHTVRSSASSRPTFKSSRRLRAVSSNELTAHALAVQFVEMVTRLMRQFQGKKITMTDRYFPLIKSIMRLIGFNAEVSRVANTSKEGSMAWRKNVTTDVHVEPIFGQDRFMDATESMTLWIDVLFMKVFTLMQKGIKADRCISFVETSLNKMVPHGLIRLDQFGNTFGPIWPRWTNEELVGAITNADLCRSRGDDTLIPVERGTPAGLHNIGYCNGPMTFHCNSVGFYILYCADCGFRFTVQDDPSFKTYRGLAQFCEIQMMSDAFAETADKDPFADLDFSHVDIIGAMGGGQKGG